MDSTGSLAAKLLSATLLFDQTSLAALEALAANSDRRILRRGEVLVREGDRSDRFFVVLSGRFTVIREGVLEPVAEIGQGELVGEVGFFAALPRIATVVAARDSIVLEIRDDQFERAAQALPSLRQSVTTFLARRFAMQSPPPTQIKQPCKLRTLAIVPAGSSRISADFIAQLRAAFAPDKRIIFLAKTELEDRFANLPFDDQAVLDWLNHLEVKADVIVYVADDEPSNWTRVCIRQADNVLLYADASDPPDLSPCEALALSVHTPSNLRLVLVHGKRTATVSGTAAWLDVRPGVRQHHHVSLEDQLDLERLVRFILGEARGFVAAGGARSAARISASTGHLSRQELPSTISEGPVRAPRSWLALQADWTPTKSTGVRTSSSSRAARFAVSPCRSMRCLITRCSTARFRPNMAIA